MALAPSDFLFTFFLKVAWLQPSAWATPADVKRAIRGASILKDGRAVFNIAGNKYRIVVWIHYPHRVVYVRFIGTHRKARSAPQKGLAILPYR
jgi:mRNA interferase HigB